MAKIIIRQPNEPPTKIGTHIMEKKKQYKTYFFVSLAINLILISSLLCFTFFQYHQT